MQLGRLLETVTGSQPESWHLVTGEIAVYIPDVSIAMSWSHAGPTADSGFLHLLFHDALVYRAAYVLRNGMYLPLPQRSKDRMQTVSRRACALLKIVDSLGRPPRPGYSTYESDVSRAGFTIVDQD